MTTYRVQYNTNVDTNFVWITLKDKAHQPWELLNLQQAEDLIEFLQRGNIFKDSQEWRVVDSHGKQVYWCNKQNFDKPFEFYAVKIA